MLVSILATYESVRPTTPRGLRGLAAVWHTARTAGPAVCGSTPHSQV